MDTSDWVPNISNLGFVEALYEDFLNGRDVPDHWKQYFAAQTNGRSNGFQRVGPSFGQHSLFDPPSLASPTAARPSEPSVGRNQLASPLRLQVPPEALTTRPVGSLRPSALQPMDGGMDMALRQDRVDQLIRAYRVRGHMIAKIDPLGLQRPHMQELDPEAYGLGEGDLDQSFSSRTIFGTETLTLRQILSRLRETYCRSIGVEFMHIHDVEVKNWLLERMEGSLNRTVLSAETQRRILTLLTDATVFEEFTQRKYLGKKTFSLEGAESLIPLLRLAIERMSEHGVDEVVLGMAHRGRLNVLANIMGKSAREIFREFEDLDPQLHRGRGDVKYHLGYSSDVTSVGGRKVHLSLCFNPSHLEYVNTVVLGRVRAKQDRCGDSARMRKASIIVHGDAAFIGEGIVQETLNLSQLTAYHTGGALHVIVNNQIGFTTPSEQARSTTYCTDVAKMLQSPIFHVNGEDPEAVAQVVEVCADFRARFQRDVVIDMYCYRRHGHNETDEPAYTQPLLYKAIAKRAGVRNGYLHHLLKLGGVTREEADRIEVERRSQLEEELTVARRKDFSYVPDWLGGVWKGYVGGPESEVEDVDTGVDLSVLTQLMVQLSEIPEGFNSHKNIERLLTQRREMALGKRRVDWGAAELAAYATLLTRGIRVRLTGQDAGRGTFAHRHAILYDQEDGRTHTPLAHLAADQASVEIYNSPLSESGVLGFEWGYSLDWPDGLVMWEAQFGDFCNAAQVIIDQFIVSAEDKWKRLSGLVVLLPHGFEGMGPEHSSARLERFLVLSAEDNIQICQPTTAAQHFHLLRRQVLRRWRKPLIVFSPKSLLRNPRATNTLDELANGRFERVISDQLPVDPQKVSRVLLCSGKVYYDLEQHREELKRNDVAIIRLEQLYPLPKKALAAAMRDFPKGTKAIWVQEEPVNMGAWAHIRVRFGQRLFGRHPLDVVARPESASPATGSASSHRIEQQELVDKAFAMA